MKRLKFEKCNITNSFVVYNSKDEKVGDVLFEKKWHRWVWLQQEEFIMSRGCLKEVVEFMEELGGRA